MRRRTLMGKKQEGFYWNYTMGDILNYGFTLQGSGEMTNEGFRLDKGGRIDKTDLIYEDYEFEATFTKDTINIAYLGYIPTNIQLYHRMLRYKSGTTFLGTVGNNAAGETIRVVKKGDTQTIYRGKEILYENVNVASDTGKYIAFVNTSMSHFTIQKVSLKPI